MLNFARPPAPTTSPFLLSPSCTALRSLCLQYTVRLSSHLASLRYLARGRSTASIRPRSHESCLKASHKPRASACRFTARPIFLCHPHPILAPRLHAGTHFRSNRSTNTHHIAFVDGNYAASNLAAYQPPCFSVKSQIRVMSVAMDQRPPEGRQRSKSNFSFKSQNSHSSDPNKHERKQSESAHSRKISDSYKPHLNTTGKADPNAAMNESQPSKLSADRRCCCGRIC